LPKILSGTISETRVEGQYLGHWRVADEVLMVKFGTDVEAVPIDGMEKDRETIASQVFAGMIDRYLAKQKKAALASAIHSHFRPHAHGNG
jgi:hypothetical protein